MPRRTVFFAAAVLLGSFGCASPPAPPVPRASLVDVETAIPSIRLDIRYATENNFTGKILYGRAACFLAPGAAELLAAVQRELETDGLGLKVFDCYRPISVQKILWETLPDPRYVANPKTGSRHNRGTAIDLTLVDSGGNELPMGTGFDEFVPQAHRTYKNLPQPILQNRKTLEAAMESAARSENARSEACIYKPAYT